MRYIFLLLLALPLAANAQFSNGFAPVGAVWYNNWYGQIGAGYAEMRVIADSVVGNTTYKKMRTRSVQTAGWGNNNQTYTSYLTIRNDSVWKDRQQVKLLYNFAANVGDEIETPQSSPTRRVFVKVDSVKNINFLGQNKRAIYYTKYCDTLQHGHYTVVAGFGVIDQSYNLLLYVSNCTIIDEGNEIFVCYNDPTRSYPQNCVVATQEKTQNQAKITVFPNPTADILKINSSETLKNIKITNLLGQIMLEKAENNTESSVSVENLPKGVYFLRINDVFVQKIVKN